MMLREKDVEERRRGRGAAANNKNRANTRDQGLGEIWGCSFVVEKQERGLQHILWRVELGL